jgi:hypothetical protein
MLVVYPRVCPSLSCRLFLEVDEEIQKDWLMNSEIMWYSADIADNIRKATAYGFGDDATADKMVKDFDWTTLKHKRDAYIKRLNGI